MREDFPFLRALFNRPDDDVLRLVYADWLEERGDRRAEYLRLDVERHRLESSAKDRRDWLTKQMGDLAHKLDAHWVGWMWQARNLPPGARLDLAVVGNGERLIEVRGGESDTALLVEGRPIALNWDDCQGSVGQYLVFTGHTRGADHARQLAEFVGGEIDASRPLADQIEPLLVLFASGTYCLTHTPSAVIGSVTTLEYSLRSCVGQELIGYYPGDLRHLICTQTSLNEERVEFFREQIRTGRRPIVLTAAAEGAWCEFVIDGHHKLAAYNRARVKPTVLSIVRSQAPEISPDEGIGWLPHRHPGISEYRRMKGYPGR